MGLRPFLPGDPKFICAQDKCSHPCCEFSGYLVHVTKAFSDNVHAQFGLKRDEFIDPIFDPPVLSHRDGYKCIFVDDNNRCKVHSIKPSGCIVYPFDLAFCSLEHNGSLRLHDSGEVHRTQLYFSGRPLDIYRLGRRYHFLIPVLVYDSNCPGFTGDPISMEDYLALVSDMFGKCLAAYRDSRKLGLPPYSKGPVGVVSRNHDTSASSCGCPAMF